ncbi:RNA-binding S4 domain-containing protein [Undibacterium sp. CY18W]|uniref:RNA-binding S4 domain-containing protein n=1 Tax=Undibacterium hunanense TaxID=2762292 RepID=A0ABR6ZXG3_9BURK|nr:RNA-binding S4 domain-containing protein [Undibacterium hunanense]MBC3920553.1 RNA-binding S4 domain-containing protein [Undibacterium hunanense]
MSDTTRIDKWLWAARFFKTRSLATNAVELGRVMQNEQRIKPAHSVKVGDLIEVQQAEQVWQVRVMRILEVRGPATVAQTMYEETAESAAKRAKVAEDRRYFREPTATMTVRPTKRDRRQLDQTRGSDS